MLENKNSPQSKCLSCNASQLKGHDWQGNYINKCRVCGFAFVEFESQEDDTVKGSQSSITTAEFFENTLKN